MENTSLPKSFGVRICFPDFPNVESNPHLKKAVGLLLEALLGEDTFTKETGYYEVVDGNHRLKAFKQLGQQFVMAYDHGTITQAAAERLAIETNETKFGVDMEKLTALLEELKLEFPEGDLLATLPFDFNSDEWSHLLDSTVDSVNNEEGEVTEDDFFHPEPTQPKTLRGDLYELNGHRILCGDSTNAEDVTRLMNGKKAHLLFTDPPYNVNYAEFNKNRNDHGKDWTDEYCSEWGDSMTDDDYKKFLIDFLKNAKDNLIEFAHYYVWHATTYLLEVIEAFKANNIPYDKVPIQWVKQVAPPSWVRYWRITEPCIFGGKGAVNGNGEGSRWFGPNGEVNAWIISREHNGKYIHPTQKPTTLAGRAIKNSSRAGELILELFLGSGSTLIASDMLNRTCFGMEYEPKFCDLIVLRFMKYCVDNNKEFTVKRNGEIIDKSFFNYPEEQIRTDDKHVEIQND